MDTQAQVQPTDMPQTDAPQAAPKPVWHAPVITRIEIKRTMLGSGQFTDGEIPSMG